MKINEQHYHYTVQTMRQLRRNVRDTLERAISNAGTEFNLTLSNVAQTKEVSIRLVQEDNVAKFMLLDKVVYTKKEVYALLKAFFQLPE